MSSLPVSPFSFSSNNLNAPRVNGQHNTEQTNNRNSGSNLSLSMSTNRLDYRRHSASPEPLIQRLSSFNSDKRAKSGSICEGQSVEEGAATNYYLPKSFSKMNGHSSQDNHLQQHHQQQYRHQKFLSLSNLGTSSHSSSQQSTNLSHQYHHSSDNIDSHKLTFKGKGTHKISTENNNLLTHNSNVHLLSSKKLPSLEKGLDVRWEVRERTSLFNESKLLFCPYRAYLVKKNDGKRFTRSLHCISNVHTVLQAINELIGYEMSYCSALRTGIQVRS